jgi:hypothetical protein
MWMGMEEQRPMRTDGRVVTELEFEPRAPAPALATGDITLAEDAPVIGVVAGDQARAYSLGAFERIEDHALNDMLGDVAVTVTYCPQSGCTRVFTQSRRSAPLDVAVGGWVGRQADEPDADSKMLLRVGRGRYFQDTGEPLADAGEWPYERADHHRTTWGEWRRMHPNTDVVVKSAEKRHSRGYRR